jgi:hypothetical protein
LFPSEIDLPLSLTAADITVKVYDRAQVGVSVITIAIIKYKTITIYNPFNGAALTRDATKYIVVTIARVKNPISLKTSGTFSISTFDFSTSNQISQVSSGVTVQPTLPGEIVAATDIPRPLTPLVSAQTNIYFDFTLPFKYTTGGYLLVTFPSDVKI